MDVMSRRLLLAGGAGAVGAAVGLNGSAAAATLVPGDGEIDLGAAYGVVAGDESAGVANAKGINKAIAEHPSGVRLVLPAGDVFVARDRTGLGPYRFAAISVNGSDKERLVLAGRGAAVTRILMTGTQDGGLTQIVQVADGPRRITLCDFSIEHGPGAVDFDPELQNHQIELRADVADVTDVEIRNVFFGTCVGDAIRLLGSAPDATPAVLRNTTIEHIVMRLDKHPNCPTRCRSGVSFQRGIRDLLLSDFFITGPKNSPLDMEPSAHNPMDNITITNGTIDNTDGDTFVAASFDGFEDSSHVTTFLTHSRMVNVRIKNGRLEVLNTSGCTLDNVVIQTSRGRADAVDSPLLLVKRDNEDLAIRNLTLLRDTGTPAGPLVSVANHDVTRPKRINVDGGTWTTRVGPGTEQSYVNIFDSTGFQLRGTRIRVEDTLSGTRTGVKVRPVLGDIANLHLDGVVIEAPAGLASGFGFGAINRNLSNIAITGCALAGTVTNAVAFTAAGSGVVDRFPILRGNDFDRAANLFVAEQAAANAVFPIIAGNRGSQVTLTGTVLPEGVVAARQGSQYLRQSGVAELWFKAGGTGPTGWIRLA
jgi:hypothetical protein